MKTSEILRKARELISDPSHWVQKRFWGGNSEDNNPNCQFCAHGACKAVENGINGYGDYYSYNGDQTYKAQNAISSVGLSFEFNDSHSHEAVLAKFDEAIANAEAEGD